MRSSHALALVILALAWLAPACARKTTAPVAITQLTRTTTVTLIDSLGAPVTGQQVSMIARTGVATIVPTYHADTDSLGRARFTLATGAWAATVEPLATASRLWPRWVAAGTFVVPGDSHAPTDTVLVRLRLGSASRITGTTTLASGTDHHGTTVTTTDCLYPNAVTDAAGHWTLDDVPPGTWSVVFAHVGYGTTVRVLDVPAPGSTVDAGAMQLPLPGDAPGHAKALQLVRHVPPRTPANR